MGGVGDEQALARPMPSAKRYTSLPLKSLQAAAEENNIGFEIPPGVIQATVPPSIRHKTLTVPCFKEIS